MADMWGELLEVHDEAAAKKKTEEELKQFTVDEARSTHRFHPSLLASLPTCEKTKQTPHTKNTILVLCVRPRTHDTSRMYPTLAPHGRVHPRRRE
jgi:hypothetical protein